MTARDTRAEESSRKERVRFGRRHRSNKGKAFSKDLFRGFFGIPSFSPFDIAASGRYCVGSLWSGREGANDAWKKWKDHGITRERIRQIICSAARNVRARRYPASLEEVSKRMESTLSGKKWYQKGRIL